MKRLRFAWLALLCLTACVPTPTPGPTPTCNPDPTFWPTDIVGPTEWVTCIPPDTPTVTVTPQPSKTPRWTPGPQPSWPTCTALPTPKPLALAIMDTCLAASGDPIVLNRESRLWQQASQMYEGCPLSPEVRVERPGGTYVAQRFLFGYLWYLEGGDTIWYMTHWGGTIHEAGPCRCYLLITKGGDDTALE